MSKKSEYKDPEKWAVKRNKENELKSSQHQEKKNNPPRATGAKLVDQDQELENMDCQKSKNCSIERLCFVFFGIALFLGSAGG